MWRSRCFSGTAAAVVAADDYDELDYMIIPQDITYLIVCLAEYTSQSHRTCYTCMHIAKCSPVVAASAAASAAACTATAGRRGRGWP